MTSASYVLTTDEHRQRCAAVVAHVPLDPPMEVTITPFKAKRSNDQNARLWAIYSAMSRVRMERTGEYVPPERLHGACKRIFLGYDVTDIRGESVETVRSSATLKVDEFTHFMNEVEVLAAEEGAFVDNWSA